MINGQPMVFLYSARFARNYDQRFVAYTKKQFDRQGYRAELVLTQFRDAYQSDSPTESSAAVALAHTVLTPSTDINALSAIRSLLQTRGTRLGAWPELARR